MNQNPSTHGSKDMRGHKSATYGWIIGLTDELMDRQAQSNMPSQLLPILGHTNMPTFHITSSTACLYHHSTIDANSL